MKTLLLTISLCALCALCGCQSPSGSGDTFPIEYYD